MTAREGAGWWRELWEDIGPDRWTLVMFAATLAIIVAVALFTAS